MSVFRVEKTRGYTVMSNHHLRNHALSLKAKGLLSQMLSLPDDWDYTLQGLAQINKESIDAIREAVRKLERAGYIERSRERDERGCLRGTVYTIYEQPRTEPTPEVPAQAKPALDNPTLEKPMRRGPIAVVSHRVRHLDHIAQVFDPDDSRQPQIDARKHSLAHDAAKHRGRPVRRLFDLGGKLLRRGVGNAAVLLLALPVEAFAQAGIAQAAGIEQPARKCFAPALAVAAVIGRMHDPVWRDVVEYASAVADLRDIHAAIRRHAQRQIPAVVDIDNAHTVRLAAGQPGLPQAEQLAQIADIRSLLLIVHVFLLRTAGSAF